MISAQTRSAFVAGENRYTFPDHAPEADLDQKPGSQGRAFLRCQRAATLGGFLPAALRNASLMRSCQPGPPPWKYSRTSWSIRSVTCSLTPGTAFDFGGATATL